MQIVNRPSVLCSFVLAVLCVGVRKIIAEAVHTHVRLNKTTLYPGLSDTTDLTAVLPSLPFVLSDQLETEAAGRCFDPQIGDECAKLNSTWSVFQATYSDNSDSPVYVCICQGSPFKAHGFAATFSHVPYFLRQWVTAIGAVPASSRSAYTYNGYITFLTDTTSQWGDVMVHESAHAQDHGFSSSDSFLTAIGSDTCVPDNYAQTNNVECYAQDMVVFLYKLWRPYAPPPAPGTACMSNQLAALRSSDAAGLQDHIKDTVAATLPNSCAINCQHTVEGGETLDSIASGCAGQTPKSLLKYNPQMSAQDPQVYIGENICFPQHCCSSRRLLTI